MLCYQQQAIIGKVMAPLRYTAYQVTGNTRMLTIGIENITVEKPFIKFSSGFICCDWCDRQIKKSHLFFEQSQTSNLDCQHSAKLCLTCGKEKRGAIYFEGFICRINRH
jgi:hypothetical protein